MGKDQAVNMKHSRSELAERHHANTASAVWRNPGRGEGRCARRRMAGYTVSALLAAAAWSGALINTAQAACETPNNIQLDVTFPNYPFWKIVVDEMKQCGNVTARFDFDASRVEVDPLVPDKDLGSLVGVSNASLYRLNQQKLLQPLDNLVEKYGVLLHPRQLIKVDGKVMAIAVTGNTKAFIYHRDLFAQNTIERPKTWAEVFLAGDKLKGGQLYEVPFSLAFNKGWNLTQEFIDQFLAAPGANLFDEENRPLLNNDAGVETLERMRRLKELLPENHMSADPGNVLDDLLKFRAPMAVLWASSAGPLENPAVSRVSGKMEVFPAPSVTADGKPSSTLWWDGFAIPVNASPEQAEAAFLTALEGMDAEMMEKNRDSAFWLVSDYVPGRLTKNLLAAIDDGMTVYPASEATTLLRRALSDHLSDFMEGKTGAAQALGLAEADYLRAARERGIAGL